ncbi:hypothetical protein JDFR1000234_34 [uncultured archaeal virus]|jgi:hypothetical protein|uniref:Uncharacterized protein n=1 Tax=uncultured archaeal virus TaxID=1960247 RepID=A0A1S5Y334_9VIRU|nr:hypothetical protein JDFR1000234_34 [uncultured archaeal virus]
MWKIIKRNSKKFKEIENYEKKLKKLLVEFLSEKYGKWLFGAEIEQFIDDGAVIRVYTTWGTYIVDKRELIEYLEERGIEI